MGKAENLIGRRVRVRRGTKVNLARASEGYHDYAIWIAGNVPIGSTGTLVELPDSGHMVQVKWDHDQEPKPGYVFGVTSISNELEEIFDGQTETT